MNRMFVLAISLFIMTSTAQATTVTWPDPSLHITDPNREAYSNYTTISTAGRPSYDYFSWGGVSVWEDIPALGGLTFTMCVERAAGGWDTSYDITPGMTAHGFSAAQELAFDKLVTNVMPGFLASASAYPYTGSVGRTAADDFGLAFQLAVWEIAEETSGTFNLSTGSISLPGGWASNPTADAMAKDFISKLSTWTATGGYRLSYAYSATAQDMIVITAVPEPETYAMLLAGLGLIGFVARRKRSA